MKKILWLVLLCAVSLPLAARDSFTAIDPNALLRSRFNYFDIGGISAGPAFSIAVSSRGWVIKTDEQGKVIWRVKSSCPPGNGPVFDSEKLYYSCENGNLVALSLADGKQLWKLSHQDSVASRPAILEQALILQTGTGKVFSIDKNTGVVQWIAKQPGRFNLTLRGAAQPLVIGKTIFLGMADGVVSALELEDGELLWKRKVFERAITSDIDFPLLYDKKYGIFAASREGVASLNEVSGKVYWNLHEEIVCSPAQNDSSIFALNIANELLVIDKLMGTAEKRIEIKKALLARWEFERPLGVFWDNQKIFALFTDAIWQIDPENGSVKKLRNFSNPVQKGTIDQGKLYVITAKGYLEILTLK